MCTAAVEEERAATSRIEPVYLPAALVTFRRKGFPATTRSKKRTIHSWLPRAIWTACWSRWPRLSHRTSGITCKPAVEDHFVSGQRNPAQEAWIGPSRAIGDVIAYSFPIALVLLGVAGPPVFSAVAAAQGAKARNLCPLRWPVLK